MIKFLIMSLGLLATAAWASQPSLQQCRSIEDGRARLACYDAIPVEKPTSPPLAPPIAARSPQASAFGQPVPDDSKDELNSRIVGVFEGWDATTVLRLENGHRWRVVDGSRAVYLLDSPKVRIVRGLFSGYVMTIEGVAQQPRVRRVN